MVPGGYDYLAQFDGALIDRISAILPFRLIRGEQTIRDKKPYVLCYVGFLAKLLDNIDKRWGVNPEGLAYAVVNDLSESLVRFSIPYTYLVTELKTSPQQSVFLHLFAFHSDFQ
jgi:hypothetical protein